jgi:hypothetical protein
MTQPSATLAVNPLAKHFRQPALYVKLTSEGSYWADGSLDLPATGEIPIYPMTTKDEITLRTPDALLNGTSVVKVIESCAPSVKDAWKMPTVDVDSTLLAIRIASYGPGMSVTSKCPHCAEEHDYDIDLSHVLGGIRMPNYSEPVETDGLAIKLKPMTYLQASKASLVAYDQQKVINNMIDDNVKPEVRQQRLEEYTKAMTDLGIDNVTNSTESITTEDHQVVTNPRYIREFYVNSPGTIMRTVQERMGEHAKEVGVKPIDSKCSACEQEFKLEIEFDYARFFAQGF